VAALFAPSAWSRAFLVLAFGWIVVSGGCTTAVTHGSGMAPLFLILSLLVVPGGAALTLVASLLGRTASTRAAQHGANALLLALGGFFFAFSDPERGASGGAVIVSILLYSIPIALVGTLFVFFGTRAIKEIGERLAERRTELLRRALRDRGEASFDALAAASGVPDTEVDDALDRLHREGRLAVVLDAPARRAFTAEGFARKEAALVAAVYRQGRTALYDLARELGMSEPRVRELLFAALAHGRFAGYVDWRRGIVFSVDAQRLREGRACPNCGGPMDLAGSGVIACPYCGTEVLLT
jgi:DNA-binding Lrp family transcriptional regulator